MSAWRSLRVGLLVTLASSSAVALLLAFWAAHALGAGEISPPTFLLGTAGIVLFLVLAASFSLQRWVLRPLSNIRGGAESIAAGDYEHRLLDTGPEEFSSLGKVLNQLTDQLFQNQDRLAENVRSLDETNQRLTEAYRELVQSEKMASLGQLSAGIAHEIGNPLGALIGYVSILKRRGEGSEILDGMEREARRIDRIVRGLLDYSRPGSSNREEVELNGSVLRVLELLREQGWLADIDLQVDLESGLPPVVGDPHRIDQVFVNLLRNAESALGGAGKITVLTRLEKYQPDRPVPSRRSDDPPGINYSHLRRSRHESSPLSPEIEPDREVIRIVIADDGPGIPEDMLGSIFDPFFTTKGPGEGTGLGLAIVAATVADLGGRIEASSSESGGATFSLWIPTALRET